MSRKHFEALAANIKNQLDAIRASDNWNEAERGVALCCAEGVARSVADACADANPRFNRNIFLAACGIN